MQSKNERAGLAQEFSGCGLSDLPKFFTDASIHASPQRERRWFVLERPRRDTNGGSETEVTVTSELQANAEGYEKK